MADTFVIWDNDSFTAPVAPATAVATSADQNNNSGHNSLRLVVEYDSLTPNGTVSNVAPSYSLTAIIETEGAIPGRFFPLAVQTRPINDLADGGQQEFIIQPNGIFDSFADEFVQVGSQAVGRIIRKQGKLGEKFRVRIELDEQGAGGPGAFVGCTLTCYGERYTS